MDHSALGDVLRLYPAPPRPLPPTSPPDDVRRLLVRVQQRLIEVGEEVDILRERIADAAGRAGEIRERIRDGDRALGEHFARLKRGIDRLSPPGAEPERSSVYTALLHRHLSDLTSLIAKECALHGALGGCASADQIERAIRNYTAANARRTDEAALGAAGCVLRGEEHSRVDSRLQDARRSLDARCALLRREEESTEHLTGSVRDADREIQLKARQLEIITRDIESEARQVDTMRDELTAVYHRSELLRRTNTCGAIRNAIDEDQLLEAEIGRRLTKMLAP